ncbi:hypothetical protein B4119_4194 [Parageobacillus caldoxylosilyticus]|uniref:HTH-type transcriptional regulatory protein TyrR n=2 Tax=Saccharococcus caldoxylosilyticus TaxID=81408 RepID=A0A150LHD1_9BACL|nr:hypothetical protein B4119_4194 [Parageobacillus caldoxylosilyticus]
MALFLFPFLHNYMDLTGIVFIDENRHIRFINKFAADILLVSQKDVLNLSWDKLFPDISIDEIIEKKTLSISLGDETFVVQKQPFYQSEKLSGFILIFQNASVLEDVLKELDSYKNLSLDLKAIFDISYDVIYVSDGKGVTLRVSSSCETLWGYKESELVGKSVYELEREGVFKPSVTRLVLEKKEKVSLVQTTKTGRRLMVVGVPIKDEEGNVVRVVNASRDITEISELQSELEMMRRLTEGYRQEIMELRTKNELEKQFVFRSEKMEKIMALVQKVASVDSNVLLLGETGVGKEVIASFIHKWSNRRESPFTMVSCAIPEELLNLELFGDEEETFYPRKGRASSFMIDNGGTLFLDEIDEMPLTLQVKLLRVLHEKESKLNNSNNSNKINVRIIAATSKNLEELVRQGRFRKDLYYLLNVVPISIPPLRERREDIIPLILHFIEQINARYSIKKRFDPKLLKLLQEYDWPGNVRELQNVVERLLVTNEENWIGVEHLPEHIRSNLTEQKSIQVNKIIPLKKAMELLEKELLEMAQKKYESTTKIAEILGVNQSTISRKLARYRKL